VHYDGAELHFLGTLVLRNWFAPRATAAPAPDPVGALIALASCAGAAPTSRSAASTSGCSSSTRTTESPTSCACAATGSGSLPMRLHAPRGHARAVGAQGGDHYSGRRTFLQQPQPLYVLPDLHALAHVLPDMPAQLLYGAVYARSATSGATCATGGAASGTCSS